MVITQISKLALIRSTFFNRSSPPFSLSIAIKLALFFSIESLNAAGMSALEEETHSSLSRTRLMSYFSPHWAVWARMKSIRPARSLLKVGLFWSVFPTPFATATITFNMEFLTRKLVVEYLSLHTLKKPAWFCKWGQSVVSAVKQFIIVDRVCFSVSFFSSKLVNLSLSNKFWFWLTLSKFSFNYFRSTSSI